MRHFLRWLGFALLISGLAGIVDSTQAQEATPAPGGQQIDFEERRILAYSPDGTVLAVWGESEDSEVLCIVEVATLQDRVCGDLSPLDAGIREEDVVFSPDSSKIAFGENSFIYFIDGDLWVMDAQSGELTNIADDGFRGGILLSGETNEPFSFDILPAWRPDGSAIAYSSSPYRNGERDGNQIVETRLDGGSPETLLTVSIDEPGVVYDGMLFSDDGNHLFFSVRHVESDNPQNGLWVAEGDGSNPRRVLEDDEELGTPVVVDVTPSGDKALVFYLEAAMQFASTGGPYYWIVDTASGEREPVEVNLPDQPEQAYVYTATLSPDGTKLLMVTRLTDPEGIVIVRDLETGQTEQVGEPIPDAGMGVRGGDPSWASNETVFIPRGPFAGTIITVKGGVDVVTPEPIPTPPEPPAPVEGTFAPGATVVTNDANVAMRSAPSTSAMVVLELEQGTALTVTGPAVEGDGFVWWPVIEPESQTVGYVREELLSPEAGG